VIDSRNSPYSQRDIDQARAILKHKIPHQLERGMDLCAKVAGESDWTLTYTAMQLDKILLDPPESRTVIHRRLT
jgi:hypothetical protein